MHYHTLKQVKFKPSQNKTGLQWEHFGILFLRHTVRIGCVNITVKLTKLTKPFIVLQEISQSAVTKLNRKQECELVCGFVVCSRVLLFAVIGPNTIKPTEIFQVFLILSV